MPTIDPLFIAVVLIMLILIGFTLVILQNLASAAGVRIRADMQRLMESYDSVLEEKTAEIRRLQRQANELKEYLDQDLPVPGRPGPQTAAEEESGPLAHPSVPSPASYRAESFSDGYGSIRQHFHLDDRGREELIEQVAVHTQDQAGRGEDAARLRESLSFDTLFRLSQLEPQQQLEVLDTTLDDRDWVLLRDFCQAWPDDPFDVTRFCGWLEDLAVLETDAIQVRSGDRAAPDTEYQQRICEGVQIVVGNKLYDYSIDEREIS